LPRLTDHQIRDVECSALEFAGRGTDEALLLTLAVDRLAVDHDELLEATARSPMRPAHIHFMITA
jgi:protocatechuate 3,4-dioxygenase beta subunit